MERDDILQILLESESGITAQGVRAEMRGRYGASGKVKGALEELVAAGLATSELDDEGLRIYYPHVARIISTRSAAGRPEKSSEAEQFFG